MGGWTFNAPSSVFLFRNFSISDESIFALQPFVTHAYNFCTIYKLCIVLACISDKRWCQHLVSWLLPAAQLLPSDHSSWTEAPASTKGTTFHCNLFHPLVHGIFTCSNLPLTHNQWGNHPHETHPLCECCPLAVGFGAHFAVTHLHSITICAEIYSLKYQGLSHTFFSYQLAKK